MTSLGFSAEAVLSRPQGHYRAIAVPAGPQSVVVPQIFSNWRAWVACTLCGVAILDGAPGDEIHPFAKCIEWGAGLSA
jgi:hypothetical protein